MNSVRQIELTDPAVTVLIDNPGHWGSSSPRQREARAILDTGATLVVLPWTMTRELGLQRIARRDVETPSGRHRAMIFEIVVTLPALAQAHVVEAASLPDVASDIEMQPRVLLGKSWLQRFHFCMLGPERRYTLTVPTLR
jgi:predicted aspartyl protease